MASDTRTKFAMAAVDFASLFNQTFSETIEGHSLRLTAPEGQSTGGGVQAMQHITLNLSNGNTIVLGSINTVARQAELRAYPQLFHQYSERFDSQSLPLSKQNHDILIEKFGTFFNSQSYQLNLAEAVPPSSPAQQPKGRSSAAWIIALVFLLLAGAGVLVYFLLNP